MKIGINDLDEDDFGMGFESSNLEPPVNEPPVLEPPQNLEPPLENNDFITDFLKSRGIDDISKIKFENENGDIEEKSWDSF